MQSGSDFERDEIEMMALSLQSLGEDSPLIDISWLDGYSRGLISSQDVLDAARDVFGLDDD